MKFIRLTARYILSRHRRN